MAKRKREFENTTYMKRIKEGRGQGEGKEYKPWIGIQDAALRGKVTRIHGIKAGRQHDTLSNHELDYLYVCDFADNVLDIREQFPLLPIETTEEISAEIGVEHPTDPYTGEHTVLTTDFLITLKVDGKKKVIARTIKELGDLNDERQIEKFEIERRYWKKIDSNFDWGIVTECNINDVLVKNIALVHPFYSLEGLQGFENISELQLQRLTNELVQRLIGNEVVVRDVADEFDNNMVLEPGTGIKIFKHLVITKQIIINMLVPINLDVPQVIFSSKTAKKNKECM